MNKEELNKLQSDAYDHLWNGRFRMALTAAQKVFKERNDDSEAAICLAWALLENGNPAKAMEYANLAVELKGDSAKARLYRGYLLMRMSIYEGAISDFETAIDKQKEFLAFTYINKARALGGMQKLEEAYAAFELGLKMDGGKHSNWSNSFKWYQQALDLHNGKIKLKGKAAEQLLMECSEAIKAKEYWFALYVSKLVLADKKLSREYPQAAVVELEAMYNMFQFRPACEKAKNMKSNFEGDKKFQSIYKGLQKYMDDVFDDDEPEEVSEDQKIEIIKKPEYKSKDEKIESPPPKSKPLKSNNGSDQQFYDNDFAEVFSINVYDPVEEMEEGSRQFYSSFALEDIEEIGVEIIFNNPFFKKEDVTLDGQAVWYLNGNTIGTNNFNLKVRNDWDSVIFTQTITRDAVESLFEGTGKVELYFNQEKVAEKSFSISDKKIIQKEEIKKPPPEDEPADQPEKQDEKAEKDYQVHKEESEKSLEECVEELNKFIGLGSVKKAVKEFIDYLEYQKERKRLGLKSKEGLAINAVFLGNPGTGKTTIARIMGNIYKAMGILEKGHVVEVDRSAMVGEYVGQTAQKTDKLVEEAMGGVLFVDEAYTLIKKGGGQDFGQEAVDILLKRMEDKKGQFSVIAAGYPNEMETFLSANPGMKSRFTHTFVFEDYDPDELYQIFEMMIKNEQYEISDDAKELLKKELLRLYRARDENFGNAREVRKIFDDVKMSLSKRYLQLTGDERSKEAMITIMPEDITETFKKDEEKDVKLPINEELLEEAQKEFDNLIGLGSVKKDVQDMIKLARYFIEQGEDVRSKFAAHVLFLGNPGTGKTTVARIMGKIYSALGIIPKGHLVETDRQGLVASYVGQTAEKTTAMIEKAMGGTLFIDEAYALVKKGGGENDFGKEAIDTLLKRMEDDRGKFVCIAAGYTNEMKDFIESNPGMQSRFTKSFTFEDYTPDEMMEIADRILKSKEVAFSDDAKYEVEKHFNDLYRNRDKNFGNARIVRNLIDKAQQKMLLRLADTPSEERSERKTIIVEDIKDIVGKAEKKAKAEVKGDPEKLEAHIKKLRNLTGLDSVKRGVDKLISSLKVAKLRKERGLRVIDKNLHSVFLGNPGTGKTTVARLISDIYKEMGMLEKGHLVEVDRAALVAGYQGQTATKTDQVITQALGGTLFIDEAYTLSRGGNDFGQEAIDTLLKRMEDYKGQFVVIVAGYTNEMKQFLESNPGLTSRFTNTFTFEDYEPRQLLEIAHNIAVDNGYKLDEGALQGLLELFTELYNKRDSNFGNARTARNTLYKAISNQEERISSLYDLADEDLMTITFEDVANLQEQS
ncbi:MAG: AAA family ATPase [Melioribacteraceae bacterium]|nr:AAA family ATPase [Melioribacteraceae bacterium]MCF8352858.1 AAA family ATPase [Melioribacteraceae bacterium]MCF8393825.1 AAA family ATPase [Melioribacteraceae bacterium]MCF8417375.1 AAA family ATPase [Melioribacteraceae bacterium]